jgi:hypothetical protein
VPTEKTAFQQHQEQEAAKAPTRTEAPIPKRGPVTIMPVSLTDQPTVRDFRALSTEAAPPREVVEEINRELDADPTLPPAAEDAPEGMTEPEEMRPLSPNSESSLPDSPTSTNDGKSEQPAADLPPAPRVSLTPGSPDAEKTAS